MNGVFRKRIEKGSLLCLILLGCIAGVWMTMRQWLPELLQARLQLADQQQLFHLFLLEAAGLLLCSGLAGFFAMGQPIPCLALLLHGMLFGLTILLHLTPALQSLRLLIWLLPYGIGTAFLLLLAARETIWLSSLFFCYAFHRQWEENMPHCRRLYLVRYAVILGLFVLLSLFCGGLQILQSLFV